MRLLRPKSQYGLPPLPDTAKSRPAGQTFMAIVRSLYKSKSSELVIGGSHLLVILPSGCSKASSGSTSDNHVGTRTCPRPGWATSAPCVLRLSLGREKNYEPSSKVRHRIKSEASLPNPSPPLCQKFKQARG